MKKFMILVLLVATFIACDHAEEALEYQPDIECIGIHPLGYYTSLGDTNIIIVVDTIKFVANNSVDSYLREVSWEYIDTEDNVFYTGDPLSIYAKIEGIVNPQAIDTTIILNLGLPLLPALNYLANPNTPEACQALMHFVAEAEYDPEKTDTCDVWFGIYYVSP